jgi:hypothetical protein
MIGGAVIVPLRINRRRVVRSIPRSSDFLRSDSLLHLLSITSPEKANVNFAFIRVDKQKEFAV